jgi:hypothetical protein
MPAMDHKIDERRLWAGVGYKPLYDPENLKPRT